jgi:ectoine hydroxylase-related dioxygenase (phytanoyl-CoA dioxygenase family)
MRAQFAAKMAGDPKSPLLTEAQVRFFEEQGYLSVDVLTTLEEGREIRQSLERLFVNKVGEKEGAFGDLVAGADHGDEMSSPQIMNPSNYIPKLRRTQCFENALCMARQLLGETARCLFDHAILKMPKIGVATPWHQDEAYRDPNFDYQELTVWVALQDVEVEAGCLHFIPKSHKAPVLDHRSANDDPTSPALECVGQFDQTSAIPCPLKASGCTIHHYRTLHCSGPNLSDNPRFAYIMTFGTVPRPNAEKRTFGWRDQRESPLEKRRLRWLRRGGIFITVWRRLRWGDLTNGDAVAHGILRAIKLLRRGR